ncbi:MAG: hypothetical protein U0Q15_03465 [Kineosporiaceae bacterium]
MKAPAAASGAADAVLDVDELDQVQLSYDALSRDPAAAAEVRERLLRRAYAWHRATNERYDAYARSCGAPDPDDIGWERIPLLPSGLFKQPGLPLRSVAVEDVAKWCVSSGTSGSRSVVPRDEATLLRFLGSITASMPALYDLERVGGHRGIVLGPSAHDAGDLWFSYVIGCLSLVMQTEAFERDGAFDVDAAAGLYLDVTARGEDVLVIGPPARVLAFTRAVTAAATRGGGQVPALPPRSYLVTAGGWKGEQARSIDPGSFRELVAGALHVRDRSQIRDSYNMVELNSVLHECAHHVKHVPPWVAAQARDPRSDEPLPDGTEGILAFWDPTATSFPGFVLSEDFGVVRSGTCRCGYSSAQVEVVRRVSTVENRGCALKMAAGHATGGRDEGADRFFRVPREEVPS